jgi:HEAT repeat protein
MTGKPITFQTVLDVLLDEQKRLTRRVLEQFSDIDPESLRALLEAWPRVARARKLLFLSGLSSLMDSDVIVSFEELGRALLTDADAAVRAQAMRLLAETDDPRLVPVLIDLLEHDEEVEPRVEAARLLGEFVLLGELGRLPDGLQRTVEDALLRMEAGEGRAELRRRALEALGYSSRFEVPVLIESAFRRQDPYWVASALVAMGRSSDERWEEHVVSMLLHDDSRIRLPAAETAGELSIQAAGPILLKMLEDEEDEAVTTAALWSMSQIGGEEIRIYLQSLLDKAEDDAQIEFLEDALDNLSFTEDQERFDLIALDPDEPEQ